MSRGTTDRIEFITDREAVPEGKRHHYDTVAESRGRVRGPFGVLLHSPPVAGRVGQLGAYIRYESELSGPQRELAILTTAREFDCAFEWAAHEPIAREEGVRDEAIAIVADREPADGLTDAEETIVCYGRELLRRNAVSEETFERARDQFGSRGVTELTATIGYYSMIACVLNAFEVLPEGDGPALP